MPEHDTHTRSLVQSFLVLLDEQRRLAMVYLETVNRGGSRTLPADLDDLDSLVAFVARDVEAVRRLLANRVPAEV
ncbi:MULTISPECIES: hypothetical protein [Ramlibacter]|uniref:Uncharacterized protein n=1 Tax=Ramlibacter pinisoli TaxID=2682844 RepID=A0A6N8IT26_9BURK|nr:MULTISPECIES: hypothetical protein [Ramlibacter]MBA2964270.1 hypothetical protein [Ramlibacter sp. CGMCC 1.13660]MVQ29236.1 hypothetical protein [Ramlibacter pinisoli]